LKKFAESKSIRIFDALLMLTTQTLKIMKTSKIGYWIVSIETLEIVKNLVAENKLSKVMDIFPDEWNICCERLDRIDVEEKMVTFVDCGLQGSGGVQDGSWGIKTR